MKIITDTGALLSPKEGEKLGVGVLPLNVIVDKKSYKEFVEIDSQEFLDMVKEGHIPSSSQPSIGETIEMFEQYPDEELLVINMADGLSGTYQSTMSAKESVDHSDNIHVINSMTLCGPQKYLVEKALALKEKGLDIHHIMKELHKSIACEKSFLIPQDFGFLKRGGRLTPLAATLGGMLKITPIMTTTKDAKRLEKYAMKKTLKSAVKEIIKAFQELGVNEEFKIYVTHAGVLKQAQDVVKQLQATFENTIIEMYDLSPVFIAQGGPGCIAIQTIRK
ncbi:DegV family protein [Allocoprobacillus halotolerans]|uniref:DegV family protein n=1 Tax=Allocoprobacillus halotolerans TaxID=2944914 RepID=A0ABY5I6W1_9FIRM|nr:DegV family protein [Allocoprobacillus halotolerans]UTY40750.1 DegV family protein [Allocoprobacillus halotolerans]